MSERAAELELVPLIQLIWGKRYQILASSLIFGLLAGGVARGMPDVYRSEVLLAPVSDVEAMGSESLLGELSRIPLLGATGAAGVPKTTLAIETLKTRRFLTDFIVSNQMVPPLLAAKDWDSDRGRWVFDDAKFDIETGEWRGEYSEVESRVREDIAYSAFRKMISVERRSDTGLLVISIESMSPIYTKEWLEDLVEQLNTQLKNQEIAEASKSKRFLERQLEKVVVTEMRSILNKLIEKQMQREMLANVRDEHVFQVLDPPVVALESSAPKRSLITIFGVFLGFVSGLLVVLSAEAVKNISNSNG